jgi:hypothetical protein
MKRMTLVVLAFIVISIFSTWVWHEWLRALYGSFFAAVAPPIYGAIGFEDAPVFAQRLRYINFVPFLGLVLVTPGLSLRRRLLGLAAGLVVIFLGHLVLNLTIAAQPIVSMVVSDTFPFFVWIVVAYPALVRFLPRPPDRDDEKREAGGRANAESDTPT